MSGRFFSLGWVGHNQSSAGLVMLKRQVIFEFRSKSSTCKFEHRLLGCLECAEMFEFFFMFDSRYIF